MARRRRRAHALATGTTYGGGTGTGKPMFGGGNINWSPFGNKNHNQAAQHGSSANPYENQPYGQQHHTPGMNQPPQGQYPPPGSAPPPPAYNTGKPEGGSYAPPPGPPPPAHTTGNDGFVGGFRK
ncbi:hypothetical protein AAF712_015598 [Marasmius tenuissimus]|uniref:Uncharacterized protein n=1 Tax=Marasmius tenuissimus TaxID=585030 RepID=A0ABR2ZA27_9AGAR